MNPSQSMHSVATHTRRLGDRSRLWPSRITCVAKVVQPARSSSIHTSHREPQGSLNDHRVTIAMWATGQRHPWRADFHFAATFAIRKGLRRWKSRLEGIERQKRRSNGAFFGTATRVMDGTLDAPKESQVQSHAVARRVLL